MSRDRHVAQARTAAQHARRLVRKASAFGRSANLKLADLKLGHTVVALRAEEGETYAVDPQAFELTKRSAKLAHHDADMAERDTKIEALQKKLATQYTRLALLHAVAVRAEEFIDPVAAELKALDAGWPQWRGTP